jgi:hypothetical protein
MNSSNSAITLSLSWNVRFLQLWQTFTSGGLTSPSTVSCRIPVSRSTPLTWLGKLAIVHLTGSAVLGVQHLAKHRGHTEKHHPWSTRF